MKSQNRTVVQAPVAQGAAGSTDIVAAPGAGLRIKVVRVVLVADAAGTIKWQENGATDLSGAIPVVTAGGFVVLGDGDTPVLETQTANVKLNIVTSVSKMFGWIGYYLEA